MNYFCQFSYFLFRNGRCSGFCFVIFLKAHALQIECPTNRDYSCFKLLHWQCMENITIHSVDDAKKVIKEKNNLTYDVIVHYNDKTEEINRSIGNLCSLTSALAIHKVLKGSDLLVKRKHLPIDPFNKSSSSFYTVIRPCIILPDH